MNTPAHAVVAFLILPNRRHDLLVFAAIVLGSIAPDLPMIGFYAWQKFALGTPEAVIWSERYYDPEWQAFFDSFNSIPLMLLVGLAAYAARLHLLLVMIASMVLHALCDLPVHHDDGHRHFFPLSDFRFQSPVSYWDSAHYGDWFLRFESALVVIGTLWLIYRTPRLALRIAYGVTGLIYVGFGVFAMMTWKSM